MDLSQLLTVSICLVTQLRLVKCASAYDKCNETVLVGDLNDMEKATLTLKMDNVRKSDRGKALYCWFRFVAAPGQFIQVDVRNIRAGMYDAKTQVCDDGYLRISDKESCSTEPDWLPPTTLCGTYSDGQVRVKRLTKHPKAFVEFKLDNARSSLGYEFDVTFLNADADTSNSSEADDKLPYGNLQRKDGKIGNTKCDWLIPIDTCLGWCDVQSPGYPGIYPPNTKCRYLLTNLDDDRVELRMGGKGFTGKFDLKRSTNCSEDYVAVYDGMSTLSPLIGRFCGLDGAHLVSSGSSLLLIFESGPGGPPWDYSGFDLQATSRWRNEYDGGDLAADTLCDWTITSAKLDEMDEKEGDVHTPDHRIKNETSCEYRFEGKYNEKIELEVVVTELDPLCLEYIEIFDGEKQIEKICADKLTKRSNTFIYNSLSPTAIVKYFSANEKIATPSPSWISFRFIHDPTVKGPPPYVNTNSKPEASGVIGSSRGSSLRFEYFTFMLDLLFVVSLLIA